MTLKLTTTVTALALLLAPLAAAAHHREGHDGGNDRASQAREDRGPGGRGVGGAQDDEDGDGEDGGARGGHPCAWGLADREEPCVPPGQAMRGVTTDDWIGAPTDGYAADQDISDERYNEILNTAELGLDTELLDEGEIYALIDDTIVVVDESGIITEVVRRAAFPGRSGD